MSTGKRLTVYERGLITASYDTLKSYAEIGRKINRSPGVVPKYHREPEDYEKKLIPGRPSLILNKAK